MKLIRVGVAFMGHKNFMQTRIFTESTTNLQNNYHFINYDSKIFITVNATGVGFMRPTLF